MKLTTLFRLRKPDGTDPVNIEDFNDNFDVIDEELGKRLESTGNASDMTAAFTQASTRTNLKTGEKISASFGKIMKWFADLKTVAFSGSYSDLSNKPSIPSGAAASQAVANNCTTTAAGSVLDARQGKVLMDKANQLSSELSRKLLDSYTFDGSTPQSVAHNKFYQTIKSLNLANTDYKRLSIVIEAGENNQNVDNYYCYRKTPNGVAFGYYQYTYVEVITLANVSSVIRWTYASGETTDITDYQPVAGAKYSLFYN